MSQSIKPLVAVNPELAAYLTAELARLGFYQTQSLLRGALFVQPYSQVALMVDHQICDRNHPYSYSEYTKEQNLLMHRHSALYRIVADDQAELEQQLQLLQACLRQEFSEGEIKAGGNRSLSEIDPSLPEAYFEQAFIDCYGREALASVTREMPIIDVLGQTRWVDYYLKRTEDSDIAIEKNGETYHHPLITGKAQYLRQLLKQNSLVAYGAKVFRWSLESMKFKQNFEDELQRYLGPAEQFALAHKVSVSRQFSLMQHQSDQLASIRQARAEGKNAFLVVLPTGTGKTEVLIADLAEQWLASKVRKALILVPSKQLQQDLIIRLAERLPEFGLEGLQLGTDLSANIMVQTYAMISRHYSKLNPDLFDYLAVDEAHHATAPTLKKVIHHFRAASLLGLTATDQRLDAQKLEDIFGSYQTDLSLVEAISQGLLAPIKAFRLHSNLDLSQIRFNGKDYLSTDLQKYVVVPSRDQLVVDLLLKYFVDSELGRKQGIIFCVSIKHAESLARLMKQQQISVMAVSGKDNKSAAYIQDYQQGKLQFLTTCSLLNEGWDSPQTSIIVMARPTMSKVLYTQQIGRGTRKAANKEALYVIDVVDNYGAASGINTTPWSIHALLGIGSYLPWGSVLAPKPHKSTGEEVILAGLYEQERLLEKINIFTFEAQYPNHISDEQLARELYISTGTVTSWVKKGKIHPAVSEPLGRRKLNYYAPHQVEEIRQTMGLAKHDDSTLFQDFWDFVKEGNYTFSYKIVMMLAMLEVMDHNGECNLDQLVAQYTAFYQSRLDAGKAVDRANCPYQNPQQLANPVAMKQSLLQNPFEKFERKRFMYHCKDLNHIAFSTLLWNQIGNQEQISALQQHYQQELNKYYEQMDAEG